MSDIIVDRDTLMIFEMSSNLITSTSSARLHHLYYIDIVSCKHWPLRDLVSKYRTPNFCLVEF